MLLAMARDIRVILIKLADRIDNMRTLDAMPPEKQERIARETMEIYAPLANRLGIQWIKVELEDLSFKYLYPKEYEDLVEQAAAATTRSARTTSTTSRRCCKDELAENGIQCMVYGRPKHLWSIHQKMVKTGRDLEQLFDIVAFRVLVENVRACYETLGVVHSKWTPIPGRFKDFIALPKPNMYQSLHTSVIGPRGERMEVQIRTADMHRVAEEGIAAHWRYKEGPHRHARRRQGSEALRLAAPAHGVAARSEGSDRVHREREDGPLRRRGLRLHAEGRRQGAAQGRDPDRPRVRDPHRGRAPLLGRARQRAHRSACATCCATATPSRSSPRRTRSRTRIG